MPRKASELKAHPPAGRPAPRRIRELKAELARAGFGWHQAKGSHTVWTHPLLPGQTLTIAGNDDDIDQRCQEQAIRKVLAKLAHAAQGEP